ncbi:alpha/beta hydrolase family protein [Niabella aurantiaca]|uniref:alpha/beta hydrolase family protein n=1 Tax=Niabella aurantiaca TaxID=379900 RepID=UPI00035DFF13|nr:alpha/beta fold hydrolase [Niabella aurantiaca]
MNWKTILNPFERYSEKELALTGILTLLLSVVLFWWLQQTNDGIYHIGPDPNLSFRQAIAEAITYTLLVSILLFIPGRIANPKTRVIDILNATLIHRIPLTLGIPLIRIPFIKNAFENIRQAYTNNTLHIPSASDLLIMLTVATLMLALFIYALILLVNGFKTAAHIKKPVYYFLFAAALIVSEIIYRSFLYPCLSTSLLFGQSIAGSWQGNLDISAGRTIPLVIHIEQSGDSLKAVMDSPAQGVKEIPVDRTAFDSNLLRFELHALKIQYAGALQGDSIAGTFTQAGYALPLVLRKNKNGNKPFYHRPQEPQPPFSYHTEAVGFKNTTQGNRLAGTLTTPTAGQDFPVVVMITGSGAQNRDEELFGHKPFLVIADYFANHGIGSLRLDDRGVGGSEKGKADPTSADFATDIHSAVEYLVQRGFKNTGLLGHSEGGVIAPIVATKNPNVKFMILMAGLGVTGAELNVQQIRLLNKVMGATDATAEKRAAETQVVVNAILKYRQPELGTELEKIYSRIFLPDSMQQNAREKNDFIRQQLSRASAPWFVFLTRYNPNDYLTCIKIPVLALNGSLDVQVAAKENLAGIKAGLEKAGNKNFEVKELPGLNHLFQEAGTGAPSEYAQIEQTMAPAVLELMTRWILKNAGTKH